MPGTVAINWERAALAARAAGLAYADGEALVAGAGRLGLQVAQVLNDAATGANACLLKGDGLAILAVRGTERDFRDIVTDLDIRKSRLAGGDFAGRVHSGFLRQARAILDGKMAAAVRGLRDRGVTVIACGHSLGGAVALLAAVRLSLPEIYSFGAPRTGDSTFVQGLAAWRGTCRCWAWVSGTTRRRFTSTAPAGSSAGRRSGGNGRRSCGGRPPVPGGAAPSSACRFRNGRSPTTASSDTSTW